MHDLPEILKAVLNSGLHTLEEWAEIFGTVPLYLEISTKPTALWLPNMVARLFELPSQEPRLNQTIVRRINAHKETNAKAGVPFGLSASFRRDNRDLVNFSLAPLIEEVITLFPRLSVKEQKMLKGRYARMTWEQRRDTLREIIARHR